MKRTMIILLTIIVLLGVAVFLFFQQPIFGKSPNGQRLERIQNSPNYKDGKFQNIHFTPDLTEGYSMAGVTWDFIFKQNPRSKPKDAIHSIKTDLTNLPPESEVLVYFGHSSYFIQVRGKRFLIDPVFSGNAAPLPGSNKSFSGTDIYTATDMPEIDYLLITHDHYDHLDYETILELKSKVKTVICGLGVGSHFDYWGYDSSKIIEKDWNESLVLNDSLTLYTATARHFSGRSFTRNNTLWLSFILQTPNLKLYLGGDSGYDTHFAELGEMFGGFDLVILDNGQYNLAWQAIHMLPDEVLRATKELNAKRLFPVHSGKFKLAHHPWDEPLIKITELNNNEIPLVTPLIGEVVNLKDNDHQFTQWWKGIN
jgi:L-ascorbate metabolism protein UlaG (beta-lactamase superfamily)